MLLSAPLPQKCQYTRIRQAADRISTLKLVSCAIEAEDDLIISSVTNYISRRGYVPFSFDGMDHMLEYQGLRALHLAVYRSYYWDYYLAVDPA